MRFFRYSCGLSGYRDSNPGLPTPEAGALTGLRYTPNELAAVIRILYSVGVPGFEPGTPCSQSRCANRAALHPESYPKQRHKSNTLLHHFQTYGPKYLVFHHTHAFFTAQPNRARPLPAVRLSNPKPLRRPTRSRLRAFLPLSLSLFYTCSCLCNARVYHPPEC